MYRPRPYLSFSQMALFERSKQAFLDQYFYGKKQKVTINMAYGSMMADGLEAEELTGDPILDLVMSKIPKFEIKDKPIECIDGKEVEIERGNRKYWVKIPVLKNGNDDVPLLAIPDTAKKNYTAFKEYKTSVRQWTQKMADESGQITFYATAIWIVKGFIPQDIELINAQVEYTEDGGLQPTGDILTFKTKRTMVDIIKMCARINRAWTGIGELFEKELI